MFNYLAINPAYAGSREVLSISMTSRNQWAGFSGAPKTQNISAHMPVNKKRIGIGIALLNDNIGVSKHTAINSYYSYRIPIKKGKLAFGTSIGISFINSYWDKINTTAPNDIVFQNNHSETLANFGFGVFYKHSKYYIGFSSPFIVNYNQETIVDNSLEFKHNNFMLSSGILFKLNDELSLKPSFLFKSYPEYAAQLDLNCSLIYKNLLWFGLSVRSEDALVWLIEYQLTSQLRFGFSHDFPTSEIANYSRGTNEILLRYEFGLNTNATNVKFF